MKQPNKHQRVTSQFHVRLLRIESSAGSSLDRSMKMRATLVLFTMYFGETENVQQAVWQCA